MKKHLILTPIIGLTRLAACFVMVAMMSGITQAQPLNVLTVDCTPFVSPGGSTFGPQNTMGMALLAVDQGGDFNVTEITPAAFRIMTAIQLSAFDLIAVNNHSARLGDNCVAGAGNGLGTTWQTVVGVQQCGGRVVLTSHDAPRFHMNAPTPGPTLFTGNEPFGAPNLVRQSALWAGSGPGTGMVIFNESTGGFVGGLGWDNPELNLPAAWGISDLSATGVFIGGVLIDGGYTSIILPGNPSYGGIIDARFGVNTIGSFSANIGDASFHNIFGSFNAAIFTPSEVLTNSGIIDVGGFGVANNAPTVPDGTPITLIRDCEIEQQVEHFKCYEAEGENVKVTVDLKDQFGPEPNVEVGKPKFFCNPVDKNGEGIVNPAAHLTCYEIEDEEHKLVVEVDNQFGVQTLDVDEPKLLCVPSEKLSFGPRDDDTDSDTDTDQDSESVVNEE